MKAIPTNQKNRMFYIILACSFIIVTFEYLLVFQLVTRNIGGIGINLLSIAVFGVLYALAFWGIRKEGIPMKINSRKIAEALVFSILGWLLYALFLLGTSMDSLDAVIQGISGVPVGLLLLRIVQTWLFVGFSEEFLFRGYLLTKIRSMFSQWSDRRSMVLAVLVSSAVFSLWHIPNRTYQILMEDVSIPLALFSLVYIFFLAIGFAYLYLRTENILLVGMVHGLIDLPFIGDGNLTAAILLFAILLYELYRAVILRKEKEALSLQPS